VTDQIRVFDRRGKVEQTSRKSQTELLLGVEESILADVERQGARDRYFKGKGEFEGELLHPFEDLDIIRELIEDPFTRIWWGERDPKTKTWLPFYNRNGERLVKATRGLEADVEHQERLWDTFGDLSIGNTHGEQEEAGRKANWNKLKMDEGAMDFRSISRDLIPDCLFRVTDFDLPNFPENVSRWLEREAWPTYNHVQGWIRRELTKVAEHKAQGDNRRKAVSAVRRAEQGSMLRATWAAFWKSWMHKVGEAKNKGRYPPMTRKQLASIKSVIESFRVEAGLEEPVMRFWASTVCTNCGIERNMLLTLATEYAFCKPCGQSKAQVLDFESREVLDAGPPEYDWFEAAAKLQERIKLLEEEKAELNEIDKLRSRLMFIERIHIKLDNNLLYSNRAAVEDRYI